MSTDGKDPDGRGAGQDGRRPFRCVACRNVFETRHDPSLVHCPTCGSGDVRPRQDE